MKKIALALTLIALPLLAFANPQHEHKKHHEAEQRHHEKCHKKTVIASPQNR